MKFLDAERCANVAVNLTYFSAARQYGGPRKSKQHKAFLSFLCREDLGTAWLAHTGNLILQHGMPKMWAVSRTIQLEATSKISVCALLSMKLSSKACIRQYLHIIACIECGLKLNDFKALFGKMLQQPAFKLEIQFSSLPVVICHLGVAPEIAWVSRTGGVDTSNNLWLYFCQSEEQNRVAHCKWTWGHIAGFSFVLEMVWVNFFPIGSEFLGVWIWVFFLLFRYSFLLLSINLINLKGIYVSFYTLECFMFRSLLRENYK